MSTFEANHPSGRPNAPRLWIIETLVVLGVLAFGYFAVTVDSSRLASAAIPAVSVDPLP